MKKLLYIVGLLLSISACSKEEQVFPVTIDSELQPYIDLFIAEGLERGHEVDFSKEGLSAQLSFIDVPGVPGSCSQRETTANVLTIDSGFWNVYNEEKRQLLIFHELGHCYLDRGHNDNKDATGACLSIMRSSDSVCGISLTDETRDELLDELFE